MTEHEAAQLEGDAREIALNANALARAPKLPQQKKVGSGDWLGRMEQTRQILEVVAAEVERAVKKFPKFNSTHEGYAVIKEELDELWEEVKKNNKWLAREEAVQVAAMAVCFITDCDAA